MQIRCGLPKVALLQLLHGRFVVCQCVCLGREHRGNSMGDVCVAIMKHVNMAIWAMYVSQLCSAYK